MIGFGPLSVEWFGVALTWWVCAALVLLAFVFGGLNALTNRVYVPTDGVVQGVVGRMGSGKSLLIVSRILLPYCQTLAKRGFLRSASERPMVRAITNFRFKPGNGVEVRTVSPGAATSIFRSLIDLATELGAVEGPWFDEDGVMHEGRDPWTGEIAEMPDREPVEFEPGKWAWVRQPILNGLVVLDELHLFANSSQMSLGTDASFFISMARKYNCEVWWASQHEMKVHKRIRDESSYIWLASKVSGVVAMMTVSGWHVARQYISPAQVELARRTAGTGRTPKCEDKRVYRFTPSVRSFYNSFELIVPDPAPVGRAGVVARDGAPAAVARAER